MTVETFARGAVALLWDASLKSLFLLAIAGVVMLCLRRASAATRHLIMLLTLLCLLLLPLLSSTLPGWRIRWPRTATVLPPVSQTLQTTFPNALLSPAPPAIQSTSPAAGGAPLPAVPDAPKSASVPWSLLGGGLWLIGVCAVLVPVSVGLVCVRQLGQGSLPIATAAVTELCAELAWELNVRRVVTLRQAEAGAVSPVPMTWGWRRPVVLLPAAVDEWPADRLCAVLLHELAHIRRRDWLWQMLMHAVCAIYWFHPGVWLVARALRTESERACDDHVLLAGIPAADYARHLVAVAKASSQMQVSFVSGLLMAQMPQVESRIRDILHTERERSKMTKQKNFTVIVMALGLAAAAGIAAASEWLTRSFSGSAACVCREALHRCR